MCPNPILFQFFIRFPLFKCASRQPRVSFFFVFRRLVIGIFYVLCVYMKARWDFMVAAYWADNYDITSAESSRICSLLAAIPASKNHKHEITNIHSLT